MSFLDFFKRKPAAKELADTIATPTLTGPRQALDALSTWDMTPDRLVQVITRAEQGFPAEFLSYAKAIEKRDLHYGAVLRIRKTAVKQIPVRVIAASDSPEDEAIADAIREHITGDEASPSPEFGALIGDLLDALGKGYAICEITWDTSGPVWKPKGYEYVDPRWFRPDPLTLKRHRLVVDGDREHDLELEPGKWIIHEPPLMSGLPIERGLSRGVAALHMLKSIGIRDWAAFVDVFGLPIKLGVVPGDASEETKDELLEVLRLIGTDAAGVITDSMKVEFVDGVKGGGRDVHERFCRWISQEQSKHVLGQTMTTEDGSSLAQAVVHQEVRGDVRDGDAGDITNTINRYVTAPFVLWNFGRPKRMPRIIVKHQPPKDIKMLSQALPQMIKVGLPIEVSVALDEFGYTMPEPGTMILGTSGIELMPSDEEIAKRQAERATAPEPDAPTDEPDPEEPEPEPEDAEDEAA